MNPSKRKISIRPEIIIIILAAIIHIVISCLLGLWFNPWPHDDGLMLTYANLAEHFRVPNLLSLVKTMSFPLFLDFVYITGVNYCVILSLVWIVAALLTMNVCKAFTKNRIFLIFAYLFVLFTPAAFDYSIGTRLYRNSIIPPFVMIVFSLFFIILFRILKDREIKAKKLVWISAALGVVFTFTYYIKEDGIWLLACLLFAILLYSIITVVRYVKTPRNLKQPKRLIQMMIVIFLPVILFVGASNVYKMINYRYFGVYEVETRNSGEIGDFVKKVYKIASDNRDEVIWAPTDAIEKAFEASETLTQHPELLQAIMTSPWIFGDAYATPIHGDFLTWVLRDALASVGLWQSEKQTDEFFAQVNDELDEAFANGTLQKDSRIQLLSSAGGLTLSEIWDLHEEMLGQYNAHIFMNSYVPGGDADTEPYVERPQYTDLASDLTHIDFLPSDEKANEVRIKEVEIGNEIASCIFGIYSIMNPILCLFALIGAIVTGFVEIKKLCKTKHLNHYMPLTIAASVFILSGISFVYTFGISWFSAFIWLYGPIEMYWLKYYSVGLVPLLSLIEIFGAYFLGKYIKNIVLKIRAKNR